MLPRFAILVPARLGSTRLPEKVLAPLGDRFLLQATLERARQTRGATVVLALVDDDRVEARVRALGLPVRRTRADHVSGTDRCAEAAATLDVDAVINLQADEPLVDPLDLEDLAAAVLEEGADMATLAHPFLDDGARTSSAAVKALVDEDGWAVGFQRVFPSAAEQHARKAVAVLHHLGVYAFRRERLLEFSRLAPSPGEQRERLEQLRALERGWRIRVLRARAPGFGVDTPEDLARLRRHLGVPDPA